MSILDELELPLIQAPMAGVSDHELATAAARAGALASLPCAMLTPQDIRQQVELVRRDTSAPLNLNFFCHQQVEPADTALARWQEVLLPYFRELKLEPDSLPASTPARQPFDEQMADVVEDLKPEVVSFHFGLPKDEWVERVKASGALVMCSATTLEEARWLESHGADVIIAQGVEAGGHRGTFLDVDDIESQPGTRELLASVVVTVDVPVVAAGGIASPELVRTMLDAGATAVQVGTALMLCPEARTSGIQRHVLKSDASQETAITNIFTGRPARAVINRLMREVGPINDLAPPFPHAAALLAPLRQEAEKQASADFSPMWCGKDASGCMDIPAVEMLRRLAGKKDTV